MTGGGLLVVVFSLDGTMSRPVGALLLLLAVAYLSWDYRAIRRIRSQRTQTMVDAGDDESLTHSVLLFVLGAGLIVIGSQFLVTSAQSLALAFGVPSAIIGFSVVAVGTSLPELVTGVTAARKGVPDLSLGNIIGANVLNLLLIVGLAASIHPLSLDPFMRWYAFTWLGVFFAGIIVLIRRNGAVGSQAGAGLLTLYVLYVLGLVALPALGLG